MVCRPKRAVELLAHETQWSLSGVRSGKGLVGSPHSPEDEEEDEERSCRCPWKAAPSWPFAYDP